ncbi:MAG: sigma-70 family RNA polymerase sigma factor [Caldilineaceae bacterium]
MLETQIDETQLVSLAQQGDQDALATLVETHQQRIYNVALRMCGNAQDAEETLQETFLSAIEALPRFEGRSQLSTWLYRIASNACLMRKRRESRDPTLLMEPDEDGGDPLPRYFVDWTYRPDDILLDRELQDFLEEAILKLPETLRIVFIWRELEGLSTAETAEAVGISESATKVRLHRPACNCATCCPDYFAGRNGGDTAGNTGEETAEESHDA